MKIIRLHMIVFLFLCGCTIPDKIYHPICISCQNSNSINTSISDIFINKSGWGTYRENDANFNKKVAIQTSFHRSWLEYAENGFHHDDGSQINSILNWIKQQTEPVYLIVYVHGWHNNADDSGDNEEADSIKFDHLLARQFDTLARLKKSGKIKVMPKVLGVYVGWRGEEYKGWTVLPWLLSILDRSEVADAIGRAGVLENDLMKISEAVRQTNRDESRMLVVGHSLGGRMLVSTFIDELNVGNPQPLGKGTLIVTLNAAVGANCFDGIFPNGENSLEFRRPTFINITSENDYATSTIYPLAGYLGLVGNCSIKHKATKKSIGHHHKYIRQVIDNSELYNPNKISQNPDECGFDNQLITDSSMFHISEVDWFKKPDKLKLMFSCPDDDNSRGVFYSVDFKQEDGVPEQALQQAVWNVRSDKSLFNYGKSSDLDLINGPHNGIISTILVRLLTEILYYENIFK